MDGRVGFWRVCALALGAVMAVSAHTSQAQPPAQQQPTPAPQPLTIERIYASPSLSGPSVRGLAVSPDGRNVAYLAAKVDDAHRYDLWLLDVASSQRRLLVDSRALGADQPLSEAEAARRERQRSAMASGISDHRWAPSGRALLFRFNERLWIIDLDAAEAGKAPAPRALTAAGRDVGDVQVSPRGGYVSFVSAQNLYTLDLKTGQERQLTPDGKDTIHNGEAEFIAQEEMDRDQGYWWAEDDSAIAFERYDEAGVDIVQRSDILAEQIVTREQRYPATGRPNVVVKLGVIAPTGGAVRWVDLGAQADMYLARVDWLPIKPGAPRRLAFQRQSRDQKHLSLIAADVDTGAQQTLLQVDDPVWVSLHSDLRFLKNEQAFIWNSEASGFAHLQVIGLDGKLRRPLTSGQWIVDEVEAVDEAAGWVYFSGNRDDALQKQLYRVPLAGGAIERISQGEGMHTVVFSTSGSIYADTFANPDTPPQVSLHEAGGKRLAWLEENRLDDAHPFAPYRAGKPKITYGSLKADDGQTLYYRVAQPHDFDPAKRYPVFMTYYGGPGNQVVNRGWVDPFEQYMTEQGYIVFKLDNRGMARRGRAFANAIHGQLAVAEISDQIKGVDWLAAQPWVDARRIGIFGWSYGGYQTAMLLAKHAERFAAGVAVAPVTDWSLYDTHYTERFLGMPSANAQGYEKSGVFAHLAGLKAPLMVVHGMADDNVLFTNTTKLYAALQQQGMRFWTMPYPGGKHGLSSVAMQTHVHHVIADFFADHVKGRQP